MRSKAVLVVLAGAGALAATALATPVSGVTAETVRGAAADELNINTHYDNGAKLRLKTSGAIEVITQRIVAEPGASFGWHHHPGENVNVVKEGTLTLYHAEHCTHGTSYGPGTSFATHAGGVHLARNNGSETLVLFATYLAPRTSPPLPVRIDDPSPGAGCPS